MARCARPARRKEVCPAGETTALSTALARRAGLRAGDTETGLVTFIQRHRSALNLDVHLHILALDGVYTFERERPRFHRAAPPTVPELERLLDTLVRRITRTLVRSGSHRARSVRPGS